MAGVLTPLIKSRLRGLYQTEELGAPTTSGSAIALQVQQTAISGAER